MVHKCQAFEPLKRDCTSNLKGRSALPKWLLLHNSTTQSDAECNVQKRKRSTENLPQGEVRSAHTETESTATEEEDFGYAFVTSGWTLSTDVQATVQTTKSRQATTDTLRLPPKPLTMLVDSGASGHYFDDELHLNPKDNLLKCMTLERTDRKTTGFDKGINTVGKKHRAEHAGLIVPGVCLPYCCCYYLCCCCCLMRGPCPRRDALWTQHEQQSTPDTKYTANKWSERQRAARPSSSRTESRH